MVFRDRAKMGQPSQVRTQGLDNQGLWYVDALRPLPICMSEFIVLMRLVYSVESQGRVWTWILIA